MRIVEKIVKGRRYYYLSESIRLGKPKVYSLFLGPRLPPKPVLEKRKAELTKKICGELAGGRTARLLAPLQIIEAEKRRRRYEVRGRRLTGAQREERDEIDTVNFVYTTLTTEGVPVTREDAGLAYRLAGKHDARQVRDENLQVALDMVQGLRAVRSSKPGLDLGFVLDLHETVMGPYPAKHPGRLREKPARIYLKSYEKAEEIGFKPAEPAQIGPKLDALILWYNQNRTHVHPIELAALVHLRFYKIHPFDDGNKRMSRLLFNKALLDNGYPLLNISKETARYFDALIRSAEKEDEMPFVQFAWERFCEGMKKGAGKQ
jgi:fido (protein-threonine AMPylation protein)